VNGIWLQVSTFGLLRHMEGFTFLDADSMIAFFKMTPLSH
jgi:hypothetical protein